MKEFNLNPIVKILLYWYIFIFISTEILSYLNILERRYILLGEILFWSVFLLLNYNKILKCLYSINFKSKATLILLVFFSLTFIQGFLSAPSTTDSMVYHLPRVMYWMQEKTLHQDVIRNPHDFMAPFGEYILLHLYFVSGSDQLLFFSQWFAYIGLVILSASIAEKLGADKKTKIITTLLVATLPMAVMQASSTQVDLIVAFLVVLSTCIALIMLDKTYFKKTLFFGFALGLGITTKATFFLYLIIPVGIALISLFKYRLKNMVLLILAGVITLAIPLRFMSQNLNLFGNILGPFQKSGETLTNDVIGISPLVSNIVRNLMIHIPVPFFNHQVQNFLDLFHKTIGIQINFVHTTCCDFQFRVLPILYPQEDIVSNPLHILLIVSAFFLIFKGEVIKNSRILLVYILTLFSFVIFALVLKWQPFHSRLQIPFFIMGTISGAVLLSRSKPGHYLLRAILAVSIPVTFGLIFFNVSRPYISYTNIYPHVKFFAPPLSNIPESFFTKERDRQYFNARFYWYDPYKKIIAKLREKEPEGRTIAFKLMDGYEYPLWLFLKQYGLSYRVIPLSQASEETIIISTSQNPYTSESYKTECIKTEIEYGYACLSLK